MIPFLVTPPRSRLLGFCVFVALTVITRAADWSPREYGAVADGVTLDTAALQQAIDAAHAAGGGTVSVDAGTYLIGTIQLRSGVTLDLAKDTILRGSPRIADYRRASWPALILAKEQDHVAITGSGTIDGQGQLVARDTLRIYESGHWIDFFPGIKSGEKVFTGSATGNDPYIDPYAMLRDGKLGPRVAPRSRDDMATWRVDEFVRPQILEFLHCRNVRISGVTLRNAANWVQSYRECDDVLISRVQVASTSYWNNDGIDLVNCRRVRIEDCDINAADDGICLKSDASTADHGCEDITVARCRIRSSASAVKFGTASHVGFRRVRIEDLDIRDTYRSAVALEAVDGGVIEDVVVRRVRARNTGNAIFLRIGQRSESRPPGVLRHVELSDFEVEIPSGRTDEGYEHAGPALEQAVNLLPASIVGLPDQPIEDVVIRNATLTYGGGARRDRAEVSLSALANVPEKRADYPEFSMFGELPAWGFYVRHAKGVRFENVSFRLASPDFRAAMVVDHAQDVTLDDVAFESAGEEPVLVLSAVTGDVLRDISWPAGARETLRRLPPSAR